MEVSGDRLAVSLQSVRQGLGDTRKWRNQHIMRRQREWVELVTGDTNCEITWKAVGEGMIEGFGFCSSVSWAVDNVLNQQFSAGGLSPL